MFRIRKQQFDALRENAVGAARERIVTRLQAALPAETTPAGPERLRALCDRGIEKADAHFMGSEEGTYHYCAAAFLYGEDFDTSPRTAWSQEFLPDPVLDEDVKCALLRLRIQMDWGKRV